MLRYSTLAFNETEDPPIFRKAGDMIVSRRRGGQDLLPGDRDFVKPSWVRPHPDLAVPVRSQLGTQRLKAIVLLETHQHATFGEFGPAG